MFGQGNQAPRPGASLQQLPPGALQPFQQGGHGVPGTGRPVLQHLSYQSGPQVYQTAAMHPHPQSGIPNMGMYVQGTQHNIGNNQAPYHYPPIQQHPQHLMQNLYHVPPPPRPSLPLPSSHSFQISESLVPPPPHPPPPPPPPPSLHSCEPPVPLACPPSAIPISDGKQLSSGVFNAASESPSPLPSSRGFPGPVKTVDVEATSGLMLTSHNNDSPVTVASLHNEVETHVSMVNGSVGMNNKSEILIPEAGSLSLRNSSSGGGLCSTSDSDIDMEDDILNLIEDLETDDLRKDQHHENLALIENLDAKQKLHGPILTPASSTGLPSEDPPGVMCGHLLGQPSIMKSPINVKRGYASADATEKPCADATEKPCANSVQEVSFAQPADSESTVLKKIGECNRVRDGESNNHSEAYERSTPVTSELSPMQKKVTEFGKETALDLKNSSMISVSLSKPAEVAKRDGSKEHSCDESQLPSQAKGRLKRDDMTSKHGKSRAEETTASLQLKVDEFGRLAKNYSSDSDSDDLHYSRKRGRRGRSKSISPFNRRRKTPSRRRYNRSRSRSYSPSRRRSRSRSPSHRRPTESISDRRRRDKIQTSICFNFRDGKCHRGSSCRYLHHESDKKGSSNLYKRKRLSDSGDKGSNFQESSKEYLGNKGSHMDDKDESHGAHPLNSTNFVHPDSGRLNNLTDKNDVSQRITVLDHAEVDQDDHTMVSYSYQRNGVGRKSVHVLEATMPQVAQGQNATNPPDDNKHQNSDQSWHPKGLPSLVNSSTPMSSKEPLEANRSAAVLQYDSLPPQKSNNSYESLSAPHQSLGTPHLFTTCDPRQSVQPPSLSSATMGSRFQSMVAENTSSQVPFDVTGTPFSKSTTGPCMPHQNSSLSAMQMATDLPPPFIPGGGPSNQFSLPNRPPQYNPRQVPIWNSLPPPPPRASIHADTPNAITSGNTIPYHFEQNQQSKKIDVVPQSISGPYSGSMHFNSQHGGNHHHNHPSVEVHRPPFAFPMQIPDSHLIVNSHRQQTEGLHFERNRQTSGQVVIPSTFHVQLSASFNHSPATGTLPWSETACHVSSQGDTILNNTSLNDPRNSMPSDSRIFGLPGKIESSSIITSSANLGVSGISDFEYPRTSAHCNMHVSASDRSLASMFSQPQMVGAQGVEAHSLREKSPSSISIRNTRQSFPESGGGQYDPLLDSLEKSSNSLVNSQRVNNQHSTGDSENVLKDNVSRKLLDTEETNRKKESEAEAIASLTTSDNEEFGETADAEVGPLENESVSNLVDIPNRYSEVAISETYPDKKSKDSRSMKLFKSAIANFVKDVLKPSWRQGNMSKEAFKTIVKKTVEKVSGSMKGHRYPKSQAKINHYIDSSERKLRKLIMGYVDKYVKV